jgi:uncharacterized membrane protein
MRHVKNVSYYDDQNTHWVVDIAGRHEWDATNEGWQRNTRIGWRATGGLRHFGEVLFQSLGPDATCVFVRLKYQPPGGLAGRIAEAAGAGSIVERALQQDLDRFADVIGESRFEGDSLDWNTIRRRRLHAIRGVTAPNVIPLRPA